MTEGRSVHTRDVIVVSLPYDADTRANSPHTYTFLKCHWSESAARMRSMFSRLSTQVSRQTTFTFSSAHAPKKQNAHNTFHKFTRVPALSRASIFMSYTLVYISIYIRVCVCIYRVFLYTGIYVFILFFCMCRCCARTHTNVESTSALCFSRVKSG